MTKQFEDLFRQAQHHQIDHDCSAPPYEDGQKLIDALLQSNAKEVLEIGTGMGYTATIMALSNPQVHIDTLEKDSEHARVASELFKAYGLSARINLINQSAEIYLPTTDKQYDFIFFDGFQIHYEFIRQYERLLKPNGILFLANNHLKSRTTDLFFESLNDPAEWKILEQFGDTKIAQRLS